MSIKRKTNADAPVIVVLLRQPRLQCKAEKRSDPFWEFGSFGITGCHQKNLMNPKKASLLKGARLAFVQGGAKGFRLVYLTPPVDAIAYADRSEVRWSPIEMPFRYDCAPIVVDADGKSDIAGFRAFIQSVNRNGWLGRFASKFRSRREPLTQAIATALIRCYESRRTALKDGLACTYEQALPVNPPCIDRDRVGTYQTLLAQM